MTQLAEAPMAGEIVTSACERVRAMAAALDAGEDINNSLRGARVLAPLLNAYEPEDAENTICDALTDLHHACDLMGLDFEKLRRRAHGHYSAELAEGPAPDIAEGWISETA